MSQNANVVYLRARSQHAPPGFNPGTLVSTRRPAQQLRQRGEFLKGPILLEHIKRAADASPIALALFLAIHHRTSVTGQEWVTTPTELLKKFGLTKQSKSDHLKPLADAGLIEIEWRGKGRTPLVRLAPQSP
jgi:DNA-binding transcriptional ArsR family regulator